MSSGFSSAERVLDPSSVSLTIRCSVVGKLLNLSVSLTAKEVREAKRQVTISKFSSKML